MKSKSKTKFDPKVVQQFFIEHTEKFVIGLVALLFVFFSYQSFLIVGSGYTKRPDALSSANAAAKAVIDKGPAQEKINEATKFPPYADLVGTYKTSIDYTRYRTPVGWNWKPFAPPQLREAPTVVPIKNLRAIPGRGAIASLNASAGTRTDEESRAAATRGRRWIVVTGLVPYKEQLVEYKAKFANASGVDLGKDVPVYRGFFVQRAEVGTGEPKWSDFQVFWPGNWNDAVVKLGCQAAAEVADPRFVNPALVSSLPHLLNSTWGNEVVCPPAIPVVERVLNPAEVPLVDDGRGGRRPPDNGQPVPPGPGPAPPPAAVPGFNAGGMDSLLPGGDAAAPQNNAAAPQSTTEPQMPDYYLLRYFDFDVKPNKQYQYRIFLVLTNPNYKLGDVLASPDLGKYELLGVNGPPEKDASGRIVNWPIDPNFPWSPPCIAARIPGDMQLLSGKVNSEKNKEISAEVRVLQWVQRTGRNGNFAKENLVRGTFLSFPEAVVKVLGAIPGERSKITQNLATNCVLVDIQGGEQVPIDKKDKSPGMILVMDESGNLVMHDEVAETKEWEEATTELGARLRGPRAGPGRPVGGIDRSEIDTDRVRRGRRLH